MLIQYPHIIIIPGEPTGDAVQNDSGDFIPAGQTAPTEQICRYEPSNVGKQYPTADGNYVLSKGMIYFPPDLQAPVIELGTVVEVPGYCKSPVLEFLNGQTHRRITV